MTPSERERLEEMVRVLREALEPFATAYNIYSSRPEFAGTLILAQICALAKHDIDSAHLQRASRIYAATTCAKSTLAATAQEGE